MCVRANTDPRGMLDVMRRLPFRYARSSPPSLSAAKGSCAHLGCVTVAGLLIGTAVFARPQVCVAETTVSEPAPASEGPARDGLYVRAGAAVGYGIGSYVYEGPADSTMGPAQMLQFDVSARGPAGEVQLAVGHAVAPRLAVAVEGGFTLARVKQSGWLGGTWLERLHSVRLGLLADYFLTPGSSWHLLAGASVVRVTPLAGSDLPDEWDGIVQPEPLLGAVVTAGGGYAWADGFTLDGRLNLLGASERRDAHQSRYRSATILIVASYTSF